VADIQAELAVFYVEGDEQVAMPYLQSIGAPVVSLSVSCKKDQFRIYEENTLDIAPSQTGETGYSSQSIAEALFTQSNPSRTLRLTFSHRVRTNSNSTVCTIKSHCLSHLEYSSPQHHLQKDPPSLANESPRLSPYKSIKIHLIIPLPVSET
jgi:hypothetical protein